MFGDFATCLQIALWPTLLAVARNPFVLLRPLEIRRIFMYHVWTLYGDGVDENTKALKQDLLQQNAYGVVLDIGAGQFLC